MSEFREIPKGGLVPEEEKIKEKLGESYSIKEKDPQFHCVCKNDKIKAEYNINSFSAEEVIDKVRESEVKKGSRAS